MIISLEKPQHAAAIEDLLDRAFGPDRQKKTAYRLRDGVDPIDGLSFVAIEHDDAGNEVIVGTIRYWPILIGGQHEAILLGPIAVEDRLQGSGLGSKLIRMSLAKAAELGHKAVILVGDAPYYERFGFSRSMTLDMQMPGPVELARFLGLELVPGALKGASGMIGRISSAREAVSAPSAKTKALAGCDSDESDRVTGLELPLSAMPAEKSFLPIKRLCIA